MKEMVTLNRREQKRLVVLNQVEEGKMIGREAAELLGLSLRHVRRMLAAYRKEGASVLAHGNRGSKPHNALDESLRKQILDLGQTTYAGCNNQHFTELLAEREGITPSLLHAPSSLPEWSKKSQIETPTEAPQSQGALSSRGDAAADR